MKAVVVHFSKDDLKPEIHRLKTSRWKVSPFFLILLIFYMSSLGISQRHLLGRDFGLLCHSFSQPGHGARQRNCHPNSHTVGTLSLIHHCHIQWPATQKDSS